MEVVPMCSAHRAYMIVHELLECYNVAKDEQYDEDPRNIEVPENEGERAVEGPNIESTTYAQSLKTKRVNIGTKENPKFAHTDDYLNDETVEKISYLLCEYWDLFPTTLLEMKGISGELGELNIPLQPNAKPVI